MIVAGLGVIVLVVAFADIVVTTVAISAGKGPVTAQVGRGIWSVVFRVAQRVQRRAVLIFGGPVVLFSVLTTWVVLLIAGWAMILGGGGAVLDAETGDPVGGLAAVQLASALLLGSGGEGVGITAGWRFAEPLVTGTGLILLSLIIAYVLPVVNATVQKRHVAAYISTLGHAPHDILERAWNGEDFGHLDLHLIALGPMISDLAERHLAYPILHYLTSYERHTAIGPSIAALDEAISLLECCTPESQLEPSVLLPVRRSVSEFLDTLRVAFIDVDDEREPSALPGISSLRETGIPMLDDDGIDQYFEDLSARRKLLVGLLAHDAWEWDDIPQGQLAVTESVSSDLPAIAPEESEVIADEDQ